MTQAQELVQYLAVEQTLRGGSVKGIDKKKIAPKTGGGGGGILLGLSHAAPKVLKLLLGAKALDTYVKHGDKVSKTSKDVHKSIKKRKEKEFLAKLKKRKK
jgi:hypothetical protein